MKIHDVEQNTSEWNQLHVGIPTAGCLDQLLTPKGEPRKGEMPRTLAFKKAAEAWRGKPLIDMQTSTPWACEQGMFLEEVGRPFFELETGKKVTEVGFITMDDGLFGCSPDGLIEGEDCGLEIKSPAAHTHVKYLFNGSLPDEYVAQVMGSMFATGFPRWQFLSYRRGFPPLLLEIQRDQVWMDAIDAALKSFHVLLREAMKRMRALEERQQLGLAA
jgi:predicted phage-related endonuclease